MLQQMYNSTMLSDFIKKQINCTPLPKYKLIKDNERMDVGVIYQCRGRLLRCTESGLFPGITGLGGTLDFLRVNDLLSVTGTGTILRTSDDGQLQEAPLTVTDRKVKFTPLSAKWDLVGTVDYSNVHSTMDVVNIVSSTYDSTTHHYLGEYLRWLHNSTGLNLMPLYNCYGQRKLSGWGIVNNRLVQDATRSIAIVPIKFNKVYTITGKCDLPVRVSAAFIDKKMLKDGDNYDYLHNYMHDTCVTFGSLQPGRAVTYTVTTDNCNSDKLPYASLVDKEKYLCMVLDAGVSSLSSLVVLEGNYSSASTQSCVDVSAMSARALPSQQIDEALVSSLSLLTYSGAEYRPFSNKLIQYLLRYSIDIRDQITDNVARIESAVDHNSSTPGMWDLILRYKLHQRYQRAQSRKGLTTYDVLGYVDSDVEDACRKGLLRSGN